MISVVMFIELTRKLPGTHMCPARVVSSQDGWKNANVYSFLWGFPTWSYYVFCPVLLYYELLPKDMTVTCNYQKFLIGV
jgi:hypothetical protein